MQVCNTLGQCHCDIGFSPPECSQPGGGGSSHSNPASPYSPRKYTNSVPLKQAICYYENLNISKIAAYYSTVVAASRDT